MLPLQSQENWTVLTTKAETNKIWLNCLRFITLVRCLCVMISRKWNGNIHGTSFHFPFDPRYILGLTFLFSLRQHVQSFGRKVLRLNKFRLRLKPSFSSLLSSDQLQCSQKIYASLAAWSYAMCKLLRVATLGELSTINSSRYLNS